MQATFVTEIDLKLANKLREGLVEQGFSLSTPQYTVFSGKKKGVSCTLYQSGKLTVQGKDKHDFITYFLEPEILQNFSYSYPELDADLTPHIGMDEAGKGDFFGPLCVAALYADEEGIKKLIKGGVQDSKRFSDQSIKKHAKELQKYPHIVIRIFPEKYNELYERFQNLNHLLAWAHTKAIEELLKTTPCDYAIIDQFANESVMKNAFKQKEININLTQRHRGEEDTVVAAASILARNAFLEGIDMLTTRMEITLPKGASKEVIRIGKKIVGRFGKEKLKEIAKIHFKSYQDVLEIPL